MASSRLPDKPLADIAGVPMVVRVAQRAKLSAAARVVVAADDQRIVNACQAHGIDAVLTRTDHPSGSDRLAEACDLLGLQDTDVVVNVQGDEPLIDPELINAVAAQLDLRRDCVVSTAAHPFDDAGQFANPNVVKVVSAAEALGLSIEPRRYAEGAKTAADAAAAIGVGVGQIVYQARCQLQRGAAVHQRQLPERRPGRDGAEAPTTRLVADPDVGGHLPRTHEVEAVRLVALVEHDVVSADVLRPAAGLRRGVGGQGPERLQHLLRARRGHRPEGRVRIGHHRDPAATLHFHQAHAVLP